MSEKFTAKYEVYDGYVSGSRPQSFTIRPDDFDICPATTDEQLEQAFVEMVEEEMRQRVEACKLNTEDFIRWAKSLSHTGEAG